MNNSKILEEIIGNQRSCDDKTVLGSHANFLKRSSSNIGKEDGEKIYAKVVEEFINKK